MQKILNRLKEPSTWAGIGVMAAAVGVGTEADWVAIGGGVIAALGIVLPEQGGR